MSNSTFDLEASYRLLLARLDRAGMPPPPALDQYWRRVLDAAVEKLRRMGIELTGSIDDEMLAADYAAWMLDSRDNGGGMPEWLRIRLRDRWRS
jgi:hypothetical protein